MTTDIVPEDTILDLKHLSPLICMEIAAGLCDAKSACERYDITAPQWERLKVNPTFVSMMQEATLAFSGDANAGKRITRRLRFSLKKASQSSIR